ncbi:Protein naked cuticle-like protein 2 [Camelus dromedarius]|uniref:Protein naked cuticle homolog n=1 Tax=Camelus dromedarius TaxID=9838 RepID=A0A5N4EBF0_CAMDR|nr:Protein naked cuticle-like protein 2 [Camelus dromedarius]
MDVPAPCGLAVPEALQCDVSVEETAPGVDVHPYGFDHGEATRETCRLMHTIYEVVDASVSHSSGSSKTLRVKLTVSPEPSSRGRKAPPLARVRAKSSGLQSGPPNQTQKHPALNGHPHSLQPPLLPPAPMLRFPIALNSCRLCHGSLPEPTRCQDGRGAHRVDPRVADRGLSAHVSLLSRWGCGRTLRGQARPVPHAGGPLRTSPCSTGVPYCVDENTEREGSNHYLDLAGIEITHPPPPPYGHRRCRQKGREAPRLSGCAGPARGAGARVVRDLPPTADWARPGVPVVQRHEHHHHTSTTTTHHHHHHHATSFSTAPGTEGRS